MSPFVIALAINLFLGNDPDCKPSYSLFADNEMWYVLDDRGIDDTPVERITSVFENHGPSHCPRSETMACRPS